MPAAKFKLNGTETSSELSKITREALYGDTKTRVLGPGDEQLTKAGVSENGRDYLSRGDIKYALALGDEFTLKATQVVSTLDGAPAQQVPSSFNVPAEFKPATADEIALLEVASLYKLENVQLPAETKLLGAFNYRAGYERKDAAIISKADGAFLLVGTLKKAPFVGMEVDSQLIAEEPAEAETGDGDFGSLF
jgi:hypothetical protein